MSKIVDGGRIVDLNDPDAEQELEVLRREEKMVSLPRLTTLGKDVLTPNNRSRQKKARPL